MRRKVTRSGRKPPPATRPAEPAKPKREPRRDFARCGAMTKRGVPCGAPAGRGTDHLGYGQCRAHGGMTPNNRKSALAAEARHRLISRSVPVEDAQPHMVLMQELQWSTGHIAALLDEITDAWETGTITERTRLALERFDAERDRRARVAEACSRVGVDEAVIRIRDAQAFQLVRAITAAARDAGIPPGYVAALGPALRQQLALAAGEVDPAAEARVAELRERISADEDRRVERAAQKYAGLIPADEMIIEAQPATT